MIEMPNCPECGIFYSDGLWDFVKRGVLMGCGSGPRCGTCSAFKNCAPTKKQLEKGVKVDCFGQVIGFDGQPLRLHKNAIASHQASIAGGGVTIAYHQTDSETAKLIMASQIFKPGKEGCVGAGMYFARNAAETHPKCTKRGVILEVEVRLGRRFQVSLADSQNGTWPRQQSCQNSLSIITAHGCRCDSAAPGCIRRISSLARCLQSCATSLCFPITLPVVLQLS